MNTQTLKLKYHVLTQEVLSGYKLDGTVEGILKHKRIELSDQEIQTRVVELEEIRKMLKL